jgi:hypothetical protein
MTVKESETNRSSRSENLGLMVDLRADWQIESSGWGGMALGGVKGE